MRYFFIVFTVRFGCHKAKTMITTCFSEKNAQIFGLTSD